MESEFVEVEGVGGIESNEVSAEQSTDVLRTENNVSAGDDPKVGVVHEFKDNTFRTRFLQVLLAFGLILWGVAIYAGVVEYKLIQDVKNENFESREQMETAANRSDQFVGIVAIVQSVVGILTIIFFMMWIYRSNKNTSALTGEMMEFSPGWSVGWFFVPIYFLWKPFKAMKEIWGICSEYSGLSGAWVVGLWWSFHLLSHTAGKASFKLGMRAEELSELSMASLVSTLSNFVDIILKIVTLILVSKIFLMQKMIREQDTLEVNLNAVKEQKPRVDWRGL